MLLIQEENLAVYFGNFRLIISEPKVVSSFKLISIFFVLAVILSRVLNSADEFFNHSEYEFRLINIATISKIKRFKSLNNLYFTN